LSSAYLNLTSKMTSILTMYGRTGSNGEVGLLSLLPYILTAGAVSHGFLPKVGSSSLRGGKKRGGILERIKPTIPDAFLLLAMETA
jgi:hypothetical protein